MPKKLNHHSERHRGRSCSGSASVHMEIWTREVNKEREFGSTEPNSGRVRVRVRLEDTERHRDFRSLKVSASF